MNDERIEHPSDLTERLENEGPKSKMVSINICSRSVSRIDPSERHVLRVGTGPEFGGRGTTKGVCACVLTKEEEVK